MGKLIRLELFNFKSYKGHHTLLFGDSYFTSIIGPNGSGKSNSMDAISFVLGIKTSHLRSTQLKDLVYRGRVLKTSKINDDGSAAAPGEQDEDAPTQRSERNDPKSAWVMAVYEDDAGDDQKWKRTITNQGVSEYRINDRVVSSKAYNEALEAENILIKARNFLVFQGDVEAIASQSPKDLTRLIEQISGSLEYKAEYERLQEESEKAAEDQNFNLHRRRGINSEIKQYQEQKREAQAFQNKADERDNAIVTQVLWKLFHFQRTIAESGAEIQKHQEELKEFRRGVEKYERNLAEAQKGQKKVGREVDKIQRAIKQKERDVEEKANDLVPIDEKVEQTLKEAEKIRRRLAEVTKDRDNQASSVSSIKKDISIVEKAQKQFENQWKEAVTKQGRQLTDADLKEYNKFKSQLHTRTSGDQAKLDKMLRQLTTDEVAVNSLKSKLDSAESQVEKFESEVQDITQRRDATKAIAKEIAKEIEAKKTEFNVLRSERTEINGKHTDLEERLQDVVRKLMEVNDGRRQNEKEQRTKDCVSTLKRLIPGVRGRVGELCKPKQKKFEEAVITALGRDFDSIVVDTEKTGTECVQYLKEQHWGPMTFIPLDNIKTNAVNSAMKGMNKARLTIDTIDFDPSLERAMSYACGSSIVCDDLETAKNICYVKNIHVKAVTLEGFVIHKAGLMTGGRVPEGRHGKRKFEDVDVAKLGKIKDKYLAEIAALPRISRPGAEEAITNELSGLQQRFMHARAELEAFEKNLASKSKELDFAERQLENIRPDYTEKLSEYEGLAVTVKEFQDAISDVQDEIFSAFCTRLGYANVRAYEAQQGTLEQEAAQKRNEFDLQKQILRSRLSFETARLQETESRLEKLEQRIEKLEQDIETYKAEKGALESAMETDSEELDRLRAMMEEQKEAHSAATENVNKARSELHKRSKNVDNTQKAIRELEATAQRANGARYNLLRRAKLEQIQIPLTEDSKSLDSLPVDALLRQQDDEDEMDVDDEEQDANLGVQDYGIDVDFEELDDDLKESENDDPHVNDALEEKISSLTAELEKLNPNMRAIDRLDSVETRLKTTEKEFEDARKKAKKTKDEFLAVKEKRFDLFNKAFTHISEQISNVYKDLTRSKNFPLGGQAYLDIEDSDSPYLSGVKYHAMPPLKRFRDMEHLSGGEKTMAALALLFAVHSYQPSPFFVLDEVDAALDNANVEKIRNYIREHAGPGMQFIVISLKTGLFQGSESLVGVYRDQEVNSSQTLTLDLRKYA